MPDYAIRIVLFMGLVILSSFLYELNYSSKAIDVTGEIISISGKAKGRNITVLINNEAQAQGTFTFSVGPVIELIEQYHVGKKIPINYCATCYPIAKIGDTPNLYSLTLMMLMLSSMVFITLVVTWLKGKKQ